MKFLAISHHNLALVQFSRREIEQKSPISPWLLEFFKLKTSGRTNWINTCLFKENLHLPCFIVDKKKSNLSFCPIPPIKIMASSAGSQYHSDSDCWISFVNWFWHLIVGNRSIGLNSYQQRPVFKKNCQRPQMSKRPMKTKKGHQRPELQKIIDFIKIQCKIINKWEYNTKKNLNFRNWKFSFS